MNQQDIMIRDLATLVRKLASTHEDETLKTAALGFLKRNGLSPNLLRDDVPDGEQEVVAVLKVEHVIAPDRRGTIVKTTISGVKKEGDSLSMHEKLPAGEYELVTRVPAPQPEIPASHTSSSQRRLDS